MEGPRARGLGRSGPRRRSGCLTCRSRKVRCDEAKPICANCKRLRLQCEYRKPVPRRADAQAPTVPENRAANTPPRPDVNFFNTVLHTDGQQDGLMPHMADASQFRPTNSVTDFSGPFDMHGFMSEITSELERKHLDLTNGLPELTRGTSLKGPDTAQIAHPEGSRALGSGNGMLLQSPVHDATWPESRATYEEHLLAYFLTIEPPPTIFGPVNLEWKYVREAVVAQSRDFRPLRSSIYCFAELHMAIKEGKECKLAPMYHQQASFEGQPYMLENVGETTLKKIFTMVFLLMLSESLSSPDLGCHGTSFLHSAYLLLQRFHSRTKLWTGFDHLVISWVSLLDVKSLIAGREGDPLIDSNGLEQSTGQSRIDSSDPGTSPGNGALTIESAEKERKKKDAEEHLRSKPGYLVYDAIVGPAFHFFVQAQQIIRRIVCIDLHHRSRGTLGDEFEVLQIAHRVGADLEALWNCRPPVLDIYDQPEELLDILSEPVAVEICQTFRQYVANFLAIFVYLHRVAFAIYPRTDRVNRAVDQIIQLATAETASSQRHLPVSFFWPLFIAGLEGTLSQRQWIVKEMQRMAASSSDATQQHPNASKVLFLLEEMTRRQDVSRTWADSKSVRRELFDTEFFVMI